MGIQEILHDSPAELLLPNIKSCAVLIPELPQSRKETSLNLPNSETGSGANTTRRLILVFDSHNKYTILDVPYPSSYLACWEEL